MFTRTAQPGLWFIAGSFAQCRIYSKYLGLQIKACELGLLPEVRLRPELQSKVRLIGAKTAARRKASASHTFLERR
jgi:putative flavoprotein involved in K+ transport